MTDEGRGNPGRVGSAALALGFAGLLPQLAGVGLIALGTMGWGGWEWWLPAAMFLATLYPAIILSFLGGMWWGFAMRRETEQAGMAAVAVLPSLLSITLVGLAVATGKLAWPLVALGCAIIATLIVDRALVARGAAPEGWMRLRVPLSIGLGGLTIAAGILLGRAGLPA